MEQLANNAQTTLANTALSGASTITVSGVTNFPTSGNFRILIDSELMLVTGISSDTFTVTRAVEGTTAANHSSGAVVTCILTAGALANLTVACDVYANRPAAASGPSLYIAKDGILPFVSDGVNWRVLEKSLGYEVPALTNFTNFGAAPTTASYAAGSTFIYNISNGSSQQLYGYEVTKTSGQTCTALILPLATAVSGSVTGVAGIYCRDHTGAQGTYFNFGINAGSPKFAVDHYANATSYTSTPTSGVVNEVPLPFWMRIRDDGTTNLNMDYSADGLNWFNFYTDAVYASYMTSGGNRYGFYVSPYSLAWGQTVLSWHVG
jgi:hypothetical protein